MDEQPRSFPCALCVSVALHNAGIVLLICDRYSTSSSERHNRYVCRFGLHLPHVLPSEVLPIIRGGVLPI